MDNNEVHAGRITMYLLVFLSSILIFVDLIEIVQLMSVWDKSLSLSKEVFHGCLKWELIFRTGTSSLSIMSAITAYLLSLGVLLHTYSYNVQDYFMIIFHYLYYIFGANMLGLSMIAFFHFNDIFYLCDKNSLTKVTNINDAKVFATGNLVTVISTFLLSSVILWFIMSRKVQDFFMNSYLNNFGGSSLYRKIFWFLLVKSKSTKNLMKEAALAVIQKEENENLGNPNLI